MTQGERRDGFIPTDKPRRAAPEGAAKRLGEIAEAGCCGAEASLWPRSGIPGEHPNQDPPWDSAANHASGRWKTTAKQRRSLPERSSPAVAAARRRRSDKKPANRRSTKDSPPSGLCIARSPLAATNGCCRWIGSELSGTRQLSIRRVRAFSPRFLGPNTQPRTRLICCFFICARRRPRWPKAPDILPEGRRRG